MTPAEMKTVVEAAGWSQWYNEAYWVHPKTVLNPEAQDHTSYGMSLEDAYRWETEGGRPFPPVMDYLLGKVDRNGREAKIGVKDEAHDHWIYKDHDPVHLWFNLTYAQYLTIPRSVLQSMPQEWQSRFVKCLEELDDAIDWHPDEGLYWVRLKDSQGRFVHDPLMNYERGRRKIPHRQKPVTEPLPTTEKID